MYTYLVLQKFCDPEHETDTLAINSFIRSSCLVTQNEHFHNLQWKRRKLIMIEHVEY